MSWSVWLFEWSFVAKRFGDLREELDVASWKRKGGGMRRKGVEAASPYLKRLVAGNG